MIYLLDTNVMWRRFHDSDPNHIVVKAALDTLLLRNDTVCITAQNLIEFQSLATRPAEANGLGYSTVEASLKAVQMKATFSFVADTPAIYSYWRTLVDKYDVKGRQVHDARLVAVMLAYGITHLVTLNPADFRRFVEIDVVTPADVH
jgi:predicted nucleic acid-binding protein